MYLRITRGRVDPAKYEEVRALAQEVAAAVSQLAGFGGYHGGGDQASGAIVAVSTWDTEAQARFDRAALGGVADRIAAAGVRLEPPEVYEVVVER
jgi:quinol monooxygenase YgiN